MIVQENLENLEFLIYRWPRSFRFRHMICRQILANLISIIPKDDWKYIEK